MFYQNKKINFKGLYAYFVIFSKHDDANSRNTKTSYMKIDK